MPPYKVPTLSTFEWQQPVLDKDLTAPPGGESKGDRYLIVGTGSGDWSGHTGDVATYNGASWDFVTKKAGMFCYVIDEGLFYRYTTSWNIFPAFASAAEDLANASTTKAIAPATNPQLIKNLKLVVNAAVNKLDIFTKSGGAIPNATNIISVAIPDGNGFTFRSRAAAYLSGTSQFIMANAAGYWGRPSINDLISDAYVYAIWDANGGIVWALGGYSGFTRVSTTTTITDTVFLLLEASSTYTRVETDYCVCVGRIRYQYDTNDNPDYTIYATGLSAPQVGWNLYPVASLQTTGFTFGGGLLYPKTVVVEATTLLDEAVAMSSKAPKDNPTFTTALTTPSIKATGAEQLKIWTYTHTITSGEITATFCDITISSVTRTKIRSLSVVYYSVVNAQAICDDTNWVTYFNVRAATTFRVNLGVGAVVNDVLSLTVIEAI